MAYGCAAREAEAKREAAPLDPHLHRMRAQKPDNPATSFDLCSEALVSRTQCKRMAVVAECAALREQAVYPDTIPLRSLIEPIVRYQRIRTTPEFREYRLWNTSVRTSPSEHVWETVHVGRNEKEKLAMGDLVPANNGSNP